MWDKQCQMNFLTVCYIFTTFTLEIRRETGNLWIYCNTIAHFPHLPLHSASFWYTIHISQSKRNTHVLATQWIRFRLANEGRKVLVDLSAKINSVRSFSFHFKWNRCASKIVKYIEIFFCALYIIPNLAVLSTVCNLIVFPHIWYGEKKAKKEKFLFLNKMPRTYNHIWHLAH